MTSFAISESARTAADNSDDTYVLVTDTKYLLNDHEIILVGNNAEAYSAMGYQRSTNNRYAVLLSDQNVSDGITISQSDISNGLQKITLKKVMNYIRFMSLQLDMQANLELQLVIFIPHIHLIII